MVQPVGKGGQRRGRIDRETKMLVDNNIFKFWWNRKVGYVERVEEMQGGMLQAGSFSSQCLTTDGKSQLVIEGCSVLNASHV